MKGGHSIVVSGPDLSFSAAHMATMSGELEPLHGHSYEVTVDLRGPLGSDSMVWDFSVVRAVVKEIIAPLDHRLILQAEGSALALAHRDGRWTIEYGSRRYEVPETDVVALPVDNSTAERLAEWIAGELESALSARGAAGTEIRVGVSEGPTQAGWYTVPT